MKTTQYQPKTDAACSCRSGIERDNCPQCEGTGQRIDFAAIRASGQHKDYTVNAFIPDMGSYTTNAHGSVYESKEENALWQFNSARRHDGLKELTLEQFIEYIKAGNVKFSEK